MRADLFLALLSFVSMAVISMLLVYQFYASKNGQLRRLMIYYWAAQAWAMSYSAIWFWMDARGFKQVSLGVGRLIAIVPLNITMIMILLYIIRQNRNHYGKH